MPYFKAFLHTLHRLTIGRFQLIIRSALTVVFMSVKKRIRFENHVVALTFIYGVECIGPLSEIGNDPAGRITTLPLVRDTPGLLARY